MVCHRFALELSTVTLSESFLLRRYRVKLRRHAQWHKHTYPHPHMHRNMHRNIRPPTHARAHYPSDWSADLAHLFDKMQTTFERKKTTLLTIFLCFFCRWFCAIGETSCLQGVDRSWTDITAILASSWEYSTAFTPPSLAEMASTTVRLILPRDWPPKRRKRSGPAGPSLQTRRPSVYTASSFLSCKSEFPSYNFL